MKPRVLLDTNLIERRDLRSGRIYKPDNPPKYGALYTSHVDVLEDDFGQSPAQLLGAFIGNADEPEETGTFLKIVGGYFYHDKWPDSGVTTKVFGVALDEEFGIVENGTRTIYDGWEHADYPKRFLNEGMWTEKFGPHHGWTFITQYAEQEDFPRSYTPLKIFVLCPEILSIKSTIGDCVYDTDFSLKRKVTFETNLEDNNPNKWLWEFGDGTSQEGSGVVAPQTDHLYADNPSTLPKLTLWYNPACEGLYQIVDLDKFTLCPTCPKIETVETTIGDCELVEGIRKRKVTFRPEVSGDEPDGWILTFGDGAEASGDGLPPDTIVHYYTKKPTEPAWLRLLGPTPCNASKFDLRLDFEECEPCPTIDEITFSATNETPKEITIEFKAVISQNSPDGFAWDFGDGSGSFPTADNGASHTFIKGNAEQHLQVRLSITGPGECSTEATAMVIIPPKSECPQIVSISAETGDCETTEKGRRRKVTFAISVKGEKPNSWLFDFGDGSVESGEEDIPSRLDHYYYSRPTVNPSLTMTGSQLCPSVKKNVELIFEECLPCPTLGQLEARVTNISSTEANVSLQVSYDGRAPERFEWDWSDGSSADVTTEPVAQHVYSRQANGSKNYNIKVTSFGPEDCSDEANTNVSIDVAQKPSLLSKILPHWIGFIGAFFIGNLLLRPAADFFHAETRYQWLTLLLLLSGLVTFFSIILWYRLGRRLSPKPDRTNSWTAIGGFVAFSGFLDTIYIQRCAADWWWIVVLALLGVGVYYIYRWVTIARPGIRSLLYFLAGCLLAAFMNTLIVAEAVFAGCLH